MQKVLLFVVILLMAQNAVAADPTVGVCRHRALVAFALAVENGATYVAIVHGTTPYGLHAQAYARWMNHPVYGTGEGYLNIDNNFRLKRVAPPLWVGPVEFVSLWTHYRRAFPGILLGR